MSVKRGGFAPLEVLIHATTIIATRRGHRLIPSTHGRAHRNRTNGARRAAYIGRRMTRVEDPNYPWCPSDEIRRTMSYPIGERTYQDDANGRDKYHPLRHEGPGLVFISSLAPKAHVLINFTTACVVTPQIWRFVEHGRCAGAERSM